jgi:hypothetical protein
MSQHVALCIPVGAFSHELSPPLPTVTDNDIISFPFVVVVFV